MVAFSDTKKVLFDASRVLGATQANLRDFVIRPHLATSTDLLHEGLQTASSEMKTTSVHRHLKERAKQKRRISFSIHPRKPMSKDWTEAQLEEQLKEYVERKALIKRLEQEHKVQGESIRLHYEAHNLQSCGGGCPRQCVPPKDHLQRHLSLRQGREEFKANMEIENFHNPKWTALCNARATTQTLPSLGSSTENPNEISISSICVGHVGSRSCDPLAHSEGAVQPHAPETFQNDQWLDPLRHANYANTNEFRNFANDPRQQWF